MKRVFITFFILAFIISPLGVFAQSPFGQEPEDPGTPTDPGTATDPSEVTGVGGVQGVGTGGGTPTATNAGSAQGAGQGVSAGGTGLLPIAQNAGGAQYAGTGLNAGNGTGSLLSGLWQYLLSLLNASALSGKNNQSTYKNQETKVAPLEFKEQWTPSTPVKEASPVYKGKLSCAYNTRNLGGYLSFATCLMIILIPIIIACLVLWFMFGSIRYINDSQHENRGEYKTFLVWGVIILFVALSFVGILRVMSKTLGI